MSPFIAIIDSQRVGKEIFFAVAAKAFAQRGRLDWSIEDLVRSQKLRIAVFGRRSPLSDFTPQ